MFTDSSEYDPELPKTVLVHEDFGYEKVFLLDGLILDEVSIDPTIQFQVENDGEMVDALRLEIDTSFSLLIIKSDLSYETVETEISIDLGEPFLLYVSYDPSKVKFEFIFNKEELEDNYNINSVSFIDILEVTIDGLTV